MITNIIVIMFLREGELKSVVFTKQWVMVGGDTHLNLLFYTVSTASPSGKF